MSHLPNNQAKSDLPCPKCRGKLIGTQATTGAFYHWCNLCKGQWISSRDLSIVFKRDSFVMSLIQSELTRAQATAFKCPTCKVPLKNGKVFETDLELDNCGQCQHYFFDDKEMVRLFHLLKEQHLPKAETPQIDGRKLTFTSRPCPVCPGESLFGVEGKGQEILLCLKCEGMETTVENLQKAAGRSIFHPTMFNFREEQGFYAVCRFCHQQQDLKNEHCIKCGKGLQRITCQPCNAVMSEYDLNDIIIERCQVCSRVWLDHGEFEKVLTALPDLNRRYQDLKRKSELEGLRKELTSKIDNYNEYTHRQRLTDDIWFWGTIAILLTD